MQIPANTRIKLLKTSVRQSKNRINQLPKEKVRKVPKTAKIAKMLSKVMSEPRLLSVPAKEEAPFRPLPVLQKSFREALPKMRILGEASA